VIRCRSRMFVTTTCVKMLTSPGSGAHRDDFWHRQDGGVGLADRQGHERDELVAESAEVKALTEGFERAVSGEMPQPGVDSQEPGEGEPFGIGERPPERARSAGRQTRSRAGGPARHRSRLPGIPRCRTGPAASATARSAFSQRSVVLGPSTRTGAGGCGITPADSTRLWRHSQYRFLHSWPAGWTGR
jgi:hypothetical protein